MTDNNNSAAAARQWLGQELDTLGLSERRVIDRLTGRQAISRDTNAAFDQTGGLGGRMADRVAAFGGSWPFIGAFLAFLTAWCILNLVLGRGAFDHYPFIFLNLVLSMLAAIQAPIIMMSQNRQGEKDRLAAAHDYEVNLKAELEIMALHEKLDRMRNDQLRQVMAQQQMQLDLLAEALRRLETRG
ncbi:DUF1003 domain-containing protein [Paracoccus sp. YIM 132242]|uniref:DUF1003 domain-containing protein n=1 Tax=Paracoccus lichenicola TaxID=2665644 RepID=A0A6L6HP86_9RHOB|nr:DUF1003 domain-containing protein [Paracoccus lichenicola]MTE00946.1 DUF1003 domain-containing protein [Paracoccus lichenicola]